MDPYALPGFAALIRLLEAGHTFVKLSALYRISKRADLRDPEPVAKEIIRVAGKTRVVFATDWPHTRFEGLDIRPFIEKVLDWCDDDSNLAERLFRGNAEDLWGVQRTDLMGSCFADQTWFIQLARLIHQLGRLKARVTRQPQIPRD